MRVLVVGAGGVGSAIAHAAAESEVLERIVVTDVDGSRASATVAECADARFVAHALDASDAGAIAALAAHERIDVVLNACDPRLNPSIFAAAFDAGCHYVDMAMTLSRPHARRPHEIPGVMLGAEQFEASERWRDRGLLALVGMGVEPGLSDVFARYAADHLFSEVDQVGVRDGADLVIDGYDFAPTFSIWTTIEECLNPPLIWERERGWFTTAPFSEPETFVFPEGIGPIECVNVEHEEVILIPREVPCRRVTFKYGLGDEFIEVLRVLSETGLASTTPIRVRGVDVSPRDVVAGRRCPIRRSSVIACTGARARERGSPVPVSTAVREVYLYHVSDNEETMARHGAQAVVWQTAINPVVALELLAAGVWTGAGVLGPEAFDPLPFLDRLRERGEEWHVDER